MPMSTYSPERLERTRRETPPRFEDWQHRVGFDKAAQITVKLWEDEGTDLIIDLFDARTPLEGWAVRQKYINKRQEMFERHWMGLRPEDQ